MGVLVVRILLSAIWVLGGTIAEQASNWNLVNSEECGAIKMRNRIIGGKNAGLGQYPWMARLGYQESEEEVDFKCGGALINPRYLLTATHCIHGYEKELTIVRLGENAADTTEDCDDKGCAPPVQDITIEKLIKHPKYDRQKARNDIALIKLEQEVEYNEFVKPICIPQGELLTKNFKSQYMEIAGWGVIDSDSEKSSAQLLYVSLPVRNHCACKKILKDLDDTQFCVGVETGQDSCTGDSGGPMMRTEYIRGQRRYHIIGVVSAGKGYCGESPAIYTNVIKYVDWILETIGENESQTSVPETVTKAENSFPFETEKPISL